MAPGPRHAQVHQADHIALNKPLHMSSVNLNCSSKGASLKSSPGISKYNLPLGGATGRAEFEQIPSARASFQKLDNFDWKVSRKVKCAKRLGGLLAHFSVYNLLYFMAQADEGRP